MDKKYPWIEKTIGFLSAINTLMRSMESVLIDLISALAPWLGPVIPAYMVYTGLSGKLEMIQPIAAVGAIVVELLGLSAVSTSLMLWDYNDKKLQAIRIQPAARKGKPAAKKGKKLRPFRKPRGLAPVSLAIGSAAFYLIVVLVVNIFLDTEASIEALIAKALLSSLSIISALIMGVRAQHSRRLIVAEELKLQRNEARKSTAPEKETTAPVEVSTAPVESQLIPVEATTAPVVIGLTGKRLDLVKLKKSRPELNQSMLARELEISPQMVSRYMKEPALQALLSSNGVSHHYE